MASIRGRSFQAGSDMNRFHLPGLFPLFFSVLQGWFSLNIDSKEFIGNMNEEFLR